MTNRFAISRLKKLRLRGAFFMQVGGGRWGSFGELTHLRIVLDHLQNPRHVGDVFSRIGNTLTDEKTKDLFSNFEMVLKFLKNRQVLQVLLAMFAVSQVTFWGFISVQASYIRLLVDPLYISVFYFEFTVALVAATVGAHLVFLLVGVIFFVMPTGFYRRLGVRLAKRDFFENALFVKAGLTTSIFPITYVGDSRGSWIVYVILLSVVLLWLGYGRTPRIILLNRLMKFSDWRLKKTRSMMDRASNQQKERVSIRTSFSLLLRLWLVGERILRKIELMFARSFKRHQVVQRRRSAIGFALVSSLLIAVFCYAGRNKAFSLLDEMASVETLSVGVLDGALVGATTNFLLMVDPETRQMTAISKSQVVSVSQILD
jgi:hypothetical protein